MARVKPNPLRSCLFAVIRRRTRCWANPPLWCLCVSIVCARSTCCATRATAGHVRVLVRVGPASRSLLPAPVARAVACLCRGQVLACVLASAYGNDEAPKTPKQLASEAGKAFRKKDFGVALHLYSQLIAAEPTAKHYYQVRHPCLCPCRALASTACPASRAHTCAWLLCVHLVLRASTSSWPDWCRCGVPASPR